MTGKTFIRFIVYCNNCKKYISPFCSNSFLWCPTCTQVNRNIEVSEITISSLEEQQTITNKLMEANIKGIKIHFDKE